MQDLLVPNAQLFDNYQQQPLLEKHPVRVWQGVSLVLLVLLIIQQAGIEAPDVLVVHEH